MLRGLPIAAGLALLLGLAACDDRPPPPRRMQTVKLLPDTPPPPPKPEEKKPEPPKEDRPQPQPQAPKPDEAPPQPQALKSDEAAGTGAGNGMVAGAVTTEYAGQAIGGASSAGGVSVAAAGAYANALTRSLNDFLARERELRRADYRARVLVWLSPQGGLQRVEIVEGTGDARTDEALRTALARFPGAAAPPPERLPQPLRLQVTNRMIG